MGKEMEMPGKNLFMMCTHLNNDALTELPKEYYIRNCMENELDIWKAMPFDEPEWQKNNYGFMTDYFNNVYGNKKSDFFNKCIFVCNSNDKPIGTCFLWKAYDKINTIHWYKIIKEYEGKGIGRALLSYILKKANENDYPIYLHTHAGCNRAIKIYSYFGFELLRDPEIGNRKNDLVECLPYLEKIMPEKYFKKLKIRDAEKYFLDAVNSAGRDEF